jgi:hypothetical protein
MRFHDAQPHIGFLYRKSPTEVLFCHLAFHYDLRKEQLKTGYFWAPCQWLEDDEITGLIVAGKLAKLKVNSQIPYGFAFEPTCFDEGLEYQPMPVGMGLTCASFIIAIFHSLELEIIELETWKNRPDDRDWQIGITRLLSRVNPPAAAVAARYIGSFRYRPEEVAGAATALDVPVDYNFATSRARGILDDLGLA